MRCCTNQKVATDVMIVFGGCVSLSLKSKGLGARAWARRSGLDARVSLSDPREKIRSNVPSSNLGCRNRIHHANEVRFQFCEYGVLTVLPCTTTALLAR